MDFTNFDQMNQMIAAASGMLSHTLLWVLGGLVLGLIVCSIGGAVGQCWREARPSQPRRQAHQPRISPASAGWAKSGNAQQAFTAGVCA